MKCSILLSRKNKKNFKMLPPDIFTQHAKCYYGWLIRALDKFSFVPFLLSKMEC